jgi:glycine cleavage system H protein
MSETRFTDQHEWVRIDGAEGTVGITRYATEQLGDVVFVELPPVGKTLTKGAEAAVVESVKAASEVYAPVGGSVSAVNEALNADPATVNASPQEDGWFFKIKLTDPTEAGKLMTEAQYADYVKGL